jgi:hypothetical protein
LAGILISLPRRNPASSPWWNIWRTFSALQPQRSARVSGEKGFLVMVGGTGSWTCEMWCDIRSVLNDTHSDV